jgi:hypothetical protein
MDVSLSPTYSNDINIIKSIGRGQSGETFLVKYLGLQYAYQLDLNNNWAMRLGMQSSYVIRDYNFSSFILAFIGFQDDILEFLLDTELNSIHKSKVLLSDQLFIAIQLKQNISRYIDLILEKYQKDYHRLTRIHFDRIFTQDMPDTETRIKDYIYHKF